jgi:predicted Zn-dependent protease
MTAEHALETLLNRREFFRLAALGGLGMSFLPLLGGCAVDPVTGRSSFTGMSTQEEIAVDHKQAPYQFSADYGVSRDRQLNAYINRVGLGLASRSHRPQMPFSFRAVNAAYINAYAFPGGSIAATRGILIELQNEAELAGLLGHEIGHVCARHAAEQAGKGMLAQLLLAGATIAVGAGGYGGAADLVQGLGSIGAGALLAHYSRDNEREADALGMEYMTRAGYSPSGMVGLMQILQENGRNNASAIELMFATHPMSSERLRFARQAANGKYASMLDNSLNRQRYMDMTAGLRKRKGAIKAMQDASKAVGKKDYRTAESALNHALRIAPDDYAALVMMAKLQLGLKRPREAARYADHATRVYPAEAQAHLVAGSADISLNHYDRALEQLTRYDAILPGNPEIGFYKGLCMERMHRTREAASMYNAYLKRVRQGDKARYAYSRLKQWGYVR